MVSPGAPSPGGAVRGAVSRLEQFAEEPGEKMDELDMLKAQLEKAVLCEEYEEAARLRDEIESLVNRNKP